MADKVTNYQCPACTGPLHFDSTTGKLVCDYCGSAYEVADIEAQYAQKQQKADAAAASDEKKAAAAIIGYLRQDNSVQAVKARTYAADHLDWHVITAQYLEQFERLA